MPQSATHFLLAQGAPDGWEKLIVPIVIGVVWILSSAWKYLEQKQKEQQAARRARTREQLSEVPATPTARTDSLEDKRRAEMEAARRWAEQNKKRKQAAFDEPPPLADRQTTIQRPSQPPPLPSRPKMQPKPKRTAKPATAASQRPRESQLGPRDQGAVVVKQQPKDFRDEGLTVLEDTVDRVQLPARPMAKRQVNKPREVLESVASTSALSASSVAQRPQQRRGISAEQLRATLNPATLRGAFLLSEVLGKPVSLRDK